MKNFGFSSIFNLQLIHHFDNLIQILECDLESREKRDETNLTFEFIKKL